MKFKTMKRVSRWTLFALILTKPGFAQEADLLNLVQGLQDQMKQMQKTINQQGEEIRRLKDRGPAVTTAPSGETPVIAPMSDYEFNERLANATGGANKWLKDLSFKGDLRLRYEGFDFTSGHPSETDSRNRFRYRLRYGFEKKFSEEMKVGFAMASGESSSGVQVDPTSTNTSFDSLFNFKDIFIEKAFASYTPAWAAYGPLKKTNITAGKIDNPFEKGSSDMIWDRDVKPEGIAEKVEFSLIDGADVDLKSYFTAGQFVLDEDASLSQGDANLFAYQLGFNAIAYTPFLERPVELLSALSYYDYDNYSINNNFLIGTTSLARGNTNSDGSATSLDAEDFAVWEYYNEIAFSPGGIPIRPFIDVAHNVANQAVGDEGFAWALGTKLGGIVKKGDWELAYAYKRIEPEAVVGAFNDSDFGNGHSGKRGSAIKAAFALTDTITINGSAFFVNNLTTGTNSVRDEEQRRFQVDLVWKF